MIPQTLSFPAPDPSNPALTVRAVVEQFLAHARAVNKYPSKAAYSGREFILGRLVEALGDRPVAYCRRSDLEAWIAAQESWNDSSKNGALRVIHAAFNWACKDDRIVKNPFRGVSWQQGDPRPPMSDEHYLAILRASDAGFRRVLLFLRETGVRPGEAAEVEWPMVDWERGVIVKRKHKARRLQKVPRPRVIVLNDVLLRLLRWMQARAPLYGDEQRIFLNWRGRPWLRGSLSQRLMRVRRRLGIPDGVVLYGLRHAFGTKAIVRGVSLKATSELMGHSSQSVTERNYVHLATQPQFLRDAAKQATGR